MNHRFLGKVHCSVTAYSLPLDVGDIVDVMVFDVTMILVKCCRSPITLTFVPCRAPVKMTC